MTNMYAGSCPKAAPKVKVRDAGLPSLLQPKPLPPACSSKSFQTRKGALSIGAPLMLSRGPSVKATDAKSAWV